MSLDGARLKIVRAKEHLDAVEEAVALYIDSEPYIVDAEHYRQYGENRAEVSCQINPRISAIIGDCLHNLRCSLDYVMWEIGGTYAGRALVPPPDGRDKFYFPICATPTEFDNGYKKLPADHKIPDPVIAELRAVQPYNTGYESLSLLNTLINADKHRLPILTLAEISGFTIVEADVQPRFLNFSEAESCMHTQATIAITWEDITMPREPVHRTLTNIFETVADVVPKFDRYVL